MYVRPVEVQGQLQRLCIIAPKPQLIMDMWSKRLKSRTAILIILKINKEILYNTALKHDSWDYRYLWIELSKIFAKGVSVVIRWNTGRCVIIRVMLGLTLPCWCSVYLLVRLAGQIRVGCNNGSENHKMSLEAVWRMSHMHFICFNYCVTLLLCKC